MDLVTSSIVLILGKYALDTGASLVKEIGPVAIGKGAEIVTTVFERVWQEDESRVLAEKFEESPEEYEVPMQETLQDILSRDPKFARSLQGLLLEYEDGVKQHSANAGIHTRVDLKGSGAVAQGRSAVAAGKGGVAVGRDVSGGIRLSSSK